MTAKINHLWRLAIRPHGMMKESDFTFLTEPILPLGNNQFLIRNVYLSIDPAIRGWLYEGKSYLPPVQIGEVVRCLGVGVVEESTHPGFATGDLVQGLLGWQEYALSNGEGITKLQPSKLPLSAEIGLFGLAGRTSYFGLLNIGQPAAGETLLVSSAAGSVGSLVGQIGKIKGLRVVGIAGSDEKCDYLVKELGFDSAVNYKNSALHEQLKTACPNGVDVYFDNVGGEILDIALAEMNDFGRVVVCGSIAKYNATAPAPGPYNFSMVTSKRLRIQGLVASDFFAREQEMIDDFTKWYGEGKIKYKLDMVQGVEAAPATVNRLFDGANNGKLVIQVSKAPGE
jgi:hypothetical protein